MASNRSRRRVWDSVARKCEKLNSNDALKRHCLACSLASFDVSLKVYLTHLSRCIGGGANVSITAPMSEPETQNEKERCWRSEKAYDGGSCVACRCTAYCGRY